MRDVVQCYVDTLYLKGMLRPPPEPVENVSEQLLERQPRPMPPGAAEPHGIRAAMRRPLALLRRHLDLNATSAVLAGKRSLRRIGG